jgi:hypothetical protein
MMEFERENAVQFPINDNDRHAASTTPLENEVDANMDCGFNLDEWFCTDEFFHTYNIEQ